MIESIEMTPKQIDLVQTTFHQVAANAEEAAERFYARLFALEPELQLLFPPEMHHQGDKFMATLAIMIFSLEWSGEAPPFIHHLGLRHNHHGIPHSAYAVAGQALLQMLEEMLGPAFTSDVAQAWKKLFERLANAMKMGEHKASAKNQDVPEPENADITDLKI